MNTIPFTRQGYQKVLEEKTMKRLSCVVDKEIADIFEAKARALGVKTATYLRNIVIADLKRNEDRTTLKDVHKAIEALVPTIAAAIGISDGKEQSKIDVLKNFLFKTWSGYLRNESTIQTKTKIG